VDDPVPVALVGRAIGVLRLGVAPTTRGLGALGVAREKR